ncbi:XRE family transcriptional regulator [Nocardia uniformis]|uniref:XRE family transcriptional regulator n=1 Tax=Nocardia uniformis TaxID=53432 RepID=A0A849CAI7_9NOCA|nr:XRE family transcriptional regulator [Nocardia uniformis]NNH75853.1 XRE family transcriptional regulator [Nocardia uniformis]
MPNERLRDALLRKGFTPASAAESIGVDTKTIERWINNSSRTPYPKHRRALAALVNEAENFLWPDAVTPERRADLAEAEVVKIYPHRSLIPPDLWSRLLRDCSERIDILVLAGLFLAEEPSFAKTVKTIVRQGLSARMLFGDPLADEANKRSEEERLANGTVPARIRNALALVETLSDIEGVEIRFHGTTLYNSIFRFDDEMIVNMHVFGEPGAYAPAMHLRRLPAGDLFETYTTSFEHVWSISAAADFSRIRA